MKNSNKKIILFDGVCNFCDASVNLILKKDKDQKFIFAPLQSEIGQKLMSEYSIDPLKTDSIILLENNKAWFKSDAAIKISKHLHGGLKWLSILWYIPKFIRDKVYDIVAANRYKLFGKKDQCYIPSKEERKRFISTEKEVLH